MNTQSSKPAQAKSTRRRDKAVPVLHDGHDGLGEHHDVQIIGSALSSREAAHANREQLIAEAAYHHAQARGFESGHELEDWLAAESEVDARLASEGRMY